MAVPINGCITVHNFKVLHIHLQSWAKMEKKVLFISFIDHSPSPYINVEVFHLTLTFNTDDGGREGCHLYFNYQFSPLFLSKIVVRVNYKNFNLVPW